MAIFCRLQKVMEAKTFTEGAKKQNHQNSGSYQQKEKGHQRFQLKQFIIKAIRSLKSTIKQQVRLFVTAHSSPPPKKNVLTN
ncbi:hypothetical protein PAHAL_8G017000 [Panicum hallii]|uniref:Uncharacterized protein n=1 Tax=Panicum hallii TaxID=206008 RepID=A0A2T8I786_9POAL|nr:hypothetical protein PAHAL_8G017000 [Panicum hallii]